MFAVLIPHIELFIALVGALAASSLALIFPPLTYLIVSEHILMFINGFEYLLVLIKFIARYKEMFFEFIYKPYIYSQGHIPS